ncbi:hypothetical protein MTQ10_06430 [Streptomyces sp. XM83C]|uniref:hypothetical protein n=1 Tax=Streptomyces sp. XM83C TaxID=2929781 RepID=UPI001FFC09AD|nr:hypothetical protein [Streptomyces sp. XM83C]MCK1819252.1 hypothetical protein [Streptomyces sp. XM83C]
MGTFGKAWMRGQVVRVVNGSSYLGQVQGPNSDTLKFAKVLCANCNNSRSQPFDAAYETFSRYVRTNSRVGEEYFSFKFSNIYGSDWRNEREALVRYFVKAIGCRLAEDGLQTPKAVIDFLDGSGKRAPHLNMEMGVNLAKLEMGKHMKFHGEEEGSLWLGDHGPWVDNAGALVGTWSFFGFQWFTLTWVFFFDRVRGRSNFYNSDKVEMNQFWPPGIAAGDAERACTVCNHGHP